MAILKGCSPEEAEKELEGILAYVERDTGGGIGIEWGLAPLEANRPDAFRRATSRAFLSLGALTHAKRESRAGIGLGLLRECSSCSSPGVVAAWEEGGERAEWLCEPCLIKRKHRRSGRSWGELVRYLGLDGDPEKYRHVDFSSLAALSSRDGYLGLIYLDGDDMGACIRRMPAPDQYMLFSGVVDEGLRKAVYSAMKEEGQAGLDADGKIPADILLLGGDDLIMVTTADLAIPLALQIAKAFQENTRKALQKGGFFDKTIAEHGLSVSAGVTIFKQRQPFRVAMDQTEALLASAKKARAAARSTEPYLDFADISQTRFLNLDQQRRLDLGVGSGTELTLWPMPAKKADRFLASARMLVESGVKRGRIASLSQIVRTGTSVTFECIRVIARAGEKERLSLNRFFQETGLWPVVPWMVDDGVRRTGMLDMETIYPFFKRD